FFFQAEDGIRDFHVTGVQTCALPIFEYLHERPENERDRDQQQAGAAIGRRRARRRCRRRHGFVSGFWAAGGAAAAPATVSGQPSRPCTHEGTARRCSVSICTTTLMPARNAGASSA